MAELALVVVGRFISLPGVRGSVFRDELGGTPEKLMEPDASGTTWFDAVGKRRPKRADGDGRASEDGACK